MRVLLIEIKELLAGKNVRMIRKLAGYFEPADIAEIWHEFTLDEQLLLLKSVETKFAADIFDFLKENQMVGLLEILPVEQKIAILNEMSPDDRPDLFSILPPDQTAKLIPLLDENEQIRARELLAYKGNTAGGLMTTEFISVTEEAKISDALRVLRERAKDIDFIHSIYVVDNLNRLKAIVALKDLLINDPRRKLETIMTTSFTSVSLDMDQEDVARTFEKYDEASLPVLDKLGRIKGIITVDDVIDVIKDEATEDIHHFGAAAVTEDYLAANPVNVAQKRVIWLIVCVLAGFISASILEYYSFLLSSIVTLSFFIPIVMHTSGSAGTQAATVLCEDLPPAK